jgi:aminomethyltransferase
MAAREVPLLSFHVEKLGASVGEFAGWRVPMSYTSTLEEHVTVRTSVGVFDVSHMGRLRIKGPDSLALLEAVFTRRISKTKEWFMSGPTLALNVYARVRDDEMPYKVSDEEWLLVPNAAYTEKMKQHLASKAREMGLKVEIEDLTARYAMIAIQGPKAVEVMEKLGAPWAADLKPLEFRLNEKLAGVDVYLVSRSGWTGEDGFEVWAEPGAMARVIEAALEAGAKPVGIAARDTLRIEMGFVLGGHEYGEDPARYPCALSLRYGMGAIDWSKKGFEGEEALRACRREGVRWIRVGLVMKKKYARVVPRQGYKIYVEDQPVGWVTSGTFSPILKRGIGMGYIDVRYAITDEPVQIEARGKMAEAKISDFPLIPGKR